MESQKRLLLRAWIEAILHHAIERVSEPERRSFVLNELRDLEADFNVKINVGDSYEIEIDYLDRSLLS